MRVGLLTGGGDCPGLNAVIRAIVRKGCAHYRDEMFGFFDAWEGVTDQRYDELTIETTRGLLPEGRHGARHPTRQPVRRPRRAWRR